MLLSILIPTLPERSRAFNTLMDHLLQQQRELPYKLQDQVEIVALLDQGKRVIGCKRNDLQMIALGDMIVFIDDDDDVSDDYLKVILDVLQTEHPDIISFEAMVTIDGGESMKCIYSSSFEKDKNALDHYERLPNHLCPVRASLAPRFLEVSFGEDSHYARELKHRNLREVHLNQVLYYYRYDRHTSRSFRNAIQ